MTWETRMLLKEGEVEPVAIVCSDIKVRDPTFDYKIEDKRGERLEREQCPWIVLIILSPTKDLAMKRGVWFRSKVEPVKGKKFIVRIQDAVNEGLGVIPPKQPDVSQAPRPDVLARLD